MGYAKVQIYRTDYGSHHPSIPPLNIPNLSACPADALPIHVDAEHAVGQGGRQAARRVNQE